MGGFSYEKYAVRKCGHMWKIMWILSELWIHEIAIWGQE